MVETLDLSGYTIDDFFWTEGWYLSGQAVMRVMNYQNQKCPPIIGQLMARYNMDKCSAFASIDEYTRNGFDYHVDEYSLCATNFVGRTEWYFETGEKFELGVGDVLYIPKGVSHGVNVLSDERLSASFIRRD
jgi:hypothetical protein